MHLAKTFKSVADPTNILTVLLANDMDLHLFTARSKDEGAYLNAQVRLRTSAGGGSNLLLRDILHGLVKTVEQSNQSDLFELSYGCTAPSNTFEFAFRCDDNPGSHIKILMGEKLFGIQTNCHNEELDYASGGMQSVQGDGPIVWLNRDMQSTVYDNLKKYVLNNNTPDCNAYSDRAFSPLKLEAA